MNSKKRSILILVANPVKTSFSYACGDAYEAAARDAGAEVQRLNIEEMDFDPVLHQGYEKIQELEPDLVRFQESITRADHLVFIYPNWWNTMPAKMKGLFDRSFLPGFAFRFNENSKFVPLLKNKTARVVNVVGSTRPFLLWCYIGPYTNELSKGILRLCGVSPTVTTSFGPTRNSSDKRREKWLNRVKAMAIRDAG